MIRNLEANIISVVQKAYDHKNDLELSVLIKQLEDEKAERAKLEGIIAENNKQINWLKSENKKATTKSASTQTQHTKKTISKPAGTQTQQVWPQIEGRETGSESELGGENEHNNPTENSGPPLVVSSDANVGTSSVHPHGPENGTANGQSNHALSELNAEPIPRPTGTTDGVVNGVRRNGYVPADKHFVITSSLGKHLQSRGIGQGVRVKWISGGKIQHVNESIRAAEEQYKVISVLVGSNNISHQESAEECMERFSEVIDTVQRNQPNATLQFCQIPLRMNQERHKREIVKLNDLLSKKMFRVAQTKFHWSQDTRAMGFLWWIGGRFR